MIEKLHCFECNSELTREEEQWYIENGVYCCDGGSYGFSACGCYGLPINPPYCDKCVKKGMKGEDNGN